MPWKSKRPITAAERRQLAAAVKRLAKCELATDKARQDLACLVVAIRRDGGVTTRALATALGEAGGPAHPSRVAQLEAACREP